MRTSDNPARLPPGLREQQRAVLSETATEGEYPAAEDLSPAPEIIVHDGKVAFGSPDDHEPQPTREPIATAPIDGRDVIVFYGEDDAQGRVVRWRNGRRYHARRWQPGGRWVPSDDMTPLPAEEPTEWLCMPAQDEPTEEAAA